jgi:hypothetical protein
VQALGVRHRGAARHNSPVIAVIDCFMGGFSLCGALLHPTALFSAEAYLDETAAEDLRKRNFTATARHHAAREVNRLVPDFQLTMTNDGPDARRAPPSPYIGPPKHWNWFTSSWQIVATLWDHWRGHGGVR